MGKCLTTKLTCPVVFSVICQLLIDYCFQFVMGTCTFPREIKKKGFKILGKNKLYYGNVEVVNFVTVAYPWST